LDGDEHPAARSGVHIASFFAGDPERVAIDLKYRLAPLTIIFQPPIPEHIPAIDRATLSVTKRH
jgi:hypothetical protein